MKKGVKIGLLILLLLIIAVGLFLIMNNYEINISGKITGNVVVHGVVPGQSPNKTLVVPGIIQFEDFDNGGQNVSYYDTTPSNGTACRTRDRVDSVAGGTNNCYIQELMAREWIKYIVNVSKTGVYNLTVRASSAVGSGNLSITIEELDITGRITIPKTNLATNFTNVTKEINLSRGFYVFKVNINNSNISYLDYMRLVLVREVEESCKVKCMDAEGVGIVDLNPSFSDVPNNYNCIHGNNCGNIIIGPINDSSSFSYDFWWTYYYKNGKTREICGCNGTEIVNGKRVSSGVITSTRYNLPLIIEDRGKLLDKVDLKIAVYKNGNRSNWLSAARSFNVSYNCVSDEKCFNEGEKVGVPGMVKKYKSCILNASNSCLYLGSAETCPSGYLFNGDSKSCVYIGESCTFSCKDNGRFCNASGVVLSPDTSQQESTGECCGIGSCYKCNAGFNFNEDLGRCVNSTCAQTCTGICSDNNVTNATSNSQGCCDGRTCYACDNGFHKNNRYCISNSCSGNLPSTNQDNGTVFGANNFTEGPIKSWSYVSSSSVGACQWTCNSTTHREVNETSGFDGCVSGFGACRTGICVSSSLNPTQATKINGDCAVGLSCYECQSQEFSNWNGSACIRCSSNQIWNGLSCVNRGGCDDGCWYDNKCVKTRGYRVNIAGKGRMFCDTSDNNWKIQKTTNSSGCVEDYECESNSCEENVCISKVQKERAKYNILRGVVCTFRKIFFSESESDCLAKYSAI